MHSETKNYRPLPTKFHILVLFLLTLHLASRSQMPQQISNQMSLPENAYTLKFIWQGDSVNHSFEPHSAILIPVRLEGCPKTFYMQFDLGSPYSLFYKQKVQTINGNYPNTKATLNTPTNADIGFTIGNTTIHAKAIHLRDFGNAAIDWNGRSPQIIGTIGVDLFDGKTLVIDYPNQKLTVGPVILKKYNTQITYTPFTYAQRSILLPATIQNKRTMLFFDTGSSRYALLTSEKTAMEMASPNATPITSNVRSWDRILIANTLQTDATIEIADKTLPLQNVTYMQGASSAQVEMMMKMGIGGMTGNKLFLKHKLILDTKNKKFALIK